MLCSGRVALVMMADPNRRFWGYYVSREAGVRSGVLYPMLNRLLDAGWLTAGWEDETEAIDGRRGPEVELSDEGRGELGGVLAWTRKEQCFRGLDWEYARRARPPTCLAMSRGGGRADRFAV